MQLPYQEIPAHHSIEKPAGDGIIRRAKPQGVKQGHRPGAHGKYVPDDSSHARRRALQRLHCRGMIVGLHLEHGNQAVPQVHRAGIFRPWAGHNPRATCRARASTAAWSACSRSVRSTKPQTCPALPDWVPGPAVPRCGHIPPGSGQFRQAFLWLRALCFHADSVTQRLFRQR